MRIGYHKLFLFQIVLFFTMLCVASGSVAADKYKPFMMAGKSWGQDLAAVVRSTRIRLNDAGFDIVGDYTPYANAHIIVVTHPDLLRLARKERNASFMAALRVGVTLVSGNIQISYNNPKYLKYAYQVKGDVSHVSSVIAEALGGGVVPFGSKRGLSKRKLGRYHYSAGMEYFDEEIELMEYASHKDANIAVVYNIRSRKGGVFPVYKLDIPGTDRTLYGVGMTQGYSSDKKIMSYIDASDTRHTAHLPYEILVDGAKIVALHPRFRIAVDFPDIKMVGQHSFYTIMSSPTDIQKSLVEAAGGIYDSGFGSDDNDFF